MIYFCVSSLLLHLTLATGSKGKALLLYSGGLDTSVILKWLINEGYDVVAYCANLGQKEDFAAAEKKGLAVGAKKVIIDDCRQDFVDNFIVPHVQANGLYENVYLMGTAIARPCIVKNAMKAAEAEGCQFVSHGATGKGNDQVRFELGFYALNPGIKMLVPWRMPEFFNVFEGRDDMIDYAQKNGIAVAQTKKKPYSTDENMYHISYESGILEDPWNAPPADMYTMTTDPRDAPDTPANIVIEFDKGIPVGVTNTDDKTTKKGTMETFVYLNKLGGEHGVGRLDIVENRFVGIKSRGVYETPAGTILRTAHVDLEGLTLDREVRRIRDQLSVRYAELAYNGSWFSPEMRFVLKAIRDSQQETTGHVKIELYKGHMYCRGRKSPFSLYDERMSSMNESGGYDPLHATGFIQVNSIRLKADHLRSKHMAEKKH